MAALSSAVSRSFLSCSIDFSKPEIHNCAAAKSSFNEFDSL